MPVAGGAQASGGRCGRRGEYLILETKGQDTDRDKTKREFLGEWVNAVNAQAGLGSWSWDVSKSPADVMGIIARHTRAAA